MMTDDPNPIHRTDRKARQIERAQSPVAIIDGRSVLGLAAAVATISIMGYSLDDATRAAQSIGRIGRTVSKRPELAAPYGKPEPRPARKFKHNRRG